MPQEGLSVTPENVPLWTMRQILRELRGMGYTAHRGGPHARDDNDWAVLVERTDGQPPPDGSR